MQLAGCLFAPPADWSPPCALLVQDFAFRDSQLHAEAAEEAGDFLCATMQIDGLVSESALHDKDCQELPSEELLLRGEEEGAAEAAAAGGDPADHLEETFATELLADIDINSASPKTEVEEQEGCV